MDFTVIFNGKGKMEMKKVLSVLLAIAVLFSTILPKTVEAAASKNWKKLYLYYIKEEALDVLGYSSGKLIYINNDNIPELYLQGSTGGLGCRLLWIYNGKIYYYHSPYGGLKYIKKKNKFYIIGRNQIECYDSFAKLEKNKITKITEGTYTVMISSDEPICHWYWNKKEVNKMTYEKNLRNATGKKYVTPKLISIDKLKRQLQKK